MERQLTEKLQIWIKQSKQINQSIKTIWINQFLFSSVKIGKLNKTIQAAGSCVQSSTGSAFCAIEGAANLVKGAPRSKMKIKETPLGFAWPCREFHIGLSPVIELKGGMQNCTSCSTTKHCLVFSTWPGRRVTLGQHGLGIAVPTWHCGGMTIQCSADRPMSHRCGGSLNADLRDRRLTPRRTPSPSQPGSRGTCEGRRHGGVRSASTSWVRSQTCAPNETPKERRLNT